MGNESSKPVKGNPNFARSDTMTSTKSSRSLKSRRSFKESNNTNTENNNTNNNNNTITSDTHNTSNSANANTHNHNHNQNHNHNTNISNAQSTYQKPISSRRSSFKSTFSSDRNSNLDSKSEHYDYIYDEDFNHEDHINHISYNDSNHNHNNNNNNLKLPPSMAILKPKSPILRMNSSTSINDTSIQHMSNIERQHSNTENYNLNSNISRRNSSTTVNSTNSRNSKNSRNSNKSRSSRSSRSINNDDVNDELVSTHGIPIDSFNNLHLDNNIDNNNNNNLNNDLDNQLDIQQKLSTSNSTSNSDKKSRSRSHSRSRLSSSSLSNRVKTPFATENSDNNTDYLTFEGNHQQHNLTNDNNNIDTTENNKVTDNLTGNITSNIDNNNTNNINDNNDHNDLYENNYQNSNSGVKSSNSSVHSHSHSRPHSRSHSIDNTNSLTNSNILQTDNDNNDNNNINNSNSNANNADNATNLENTETLNSNDFRRRYNLNIEDLIQRLLDAGYSGKRTKSVCLKNSEIALICSVSREIFLSQPTLLELSAPVKIVGDVHGQYIDLIRIFSKCGFPPASNYLFLGDYVDRGKQSLETILLLLCYKIKFPENFFLLRGNHECAQITRQYGFYDECKRRTNLKTWKLFVDTFNTLPIAAIVAGKIFCVHGGLSPVLNSMDEIRNIRRPTDVPDFGLLNDLLWSDPVDSPNQWEDNERGVSYCYNKVSINNFLNKFQFDLIVRAHMVVEDGYEFFNDRSLVTVFSAPNYCGEFDNWGAVMGVSEELLCSFELLEPLDSVTLKSLMKKGRIERRNAMLNYAGSPSK